MIAGNATPSDARMMWNPSVNAIWLRAASSWEASGRAALMGQPRGPQQSHDYRRRSSRQAMRGPRPCASPGADDSRLLLPRAGGLADEMVALGDVRRPPGGVGVGRGGGGQVAAELVQVAPDRVPAVAVAEHVAEPVGLAQAGGGAEHVADRDGAAEHGGRLLADRVVGEGDEVVVPGEDLRPVGLLGAGSVVVE